MRHDPFQPVEVAEAKLPRKADLWALPPLPPGFRQITGKRGPKEGKYWVQCRNGWIDWQAPWPAQGPRWKWGERPDDWDVVAVKDA